MFDRITYKQKAKETYRKYPLIAILVGICITILSYSVDLDINTLLNNTQSSSEGLYMIIRGPLFMFRHLPIMFLALIFIALQVILAPLKNIAIYYYKQLSLGQTSLGLGKYAKNGLYLNLVIICVLSTLGIAFASLLIIPGIYLSYAWRYVALITIDNPELSVREIFRRSVDITYEKKLSLFILDISFLGWIILAAIGGILSFGILTIVGTIIFEPYFSLAAIEAYKSMEFDYQLT